MEKKKQYHTLRTVTCQINGFYLLNALSNQIFIKVSRYDHTSIFFNIFWHIYLLNTTGFRFPLTEISPSFQRIWCNTTF